MLSFKPTVFGTSGLTSVENQVRNLIAAAEANIEQLTTQIRELSVMRDRERSILATLRLMVVPIGKLPTELLVEIFKLVVTDPMNPTSSRWGYRPDPRAALRKTLCLSQVSPYWRQIVHHSRQLWAQGVVDIRLGREMTDRYLDGLETLLSRSNPLPISVSVVRDAKSQNRNPSQATTTIPRILIPTAHRWQSLSIRLKSFVPFKDLPPATFEALETLSIEDFSKQTEPIVGFQRSPRLRNFTLNTYQAPLAKIGLFHLPWSQLTLLDVDDVSLGGCRSALLQCYNIVSANFTTSFEWDLASSPTEAPATTLPFLNQLTLDFNGESNPNEIHGIEAFILPLVLPSLLTLTIQFNGTDGSEPWPTTVFSAFQRRSPKIEEISMHFCCINSEEMITLLRHGPALTTLELDNCWECVGDRFFQALQYKAADSTPLAPKLQNIAFSDVGMEFEPAVLEAAIRSRWWKDVQLPPGGSPLPISRLASVIVSCSMDGTEDDTDLSLYSKRGMQDLVEQGLDLQLT
ncbi:hypothetical protein DFH06DRAFT_503205 [Mycena polygramma]|nr:hypothetical protein DFH06DRAFT_503205 [Mycena polygramma]